MLELRFEPGTFDAVVSCSASDHLPRQEHAELFRRVPGRLRPGGLLLLAVEAGDQPGVVGDRLGAPLFFSHFDAETTLQLVRDAGFTVLHRAIEPQREQGRPVPYLWVLAGKPA